MASNDHIAKLRAGTAAWNTWRESSDERPDLRDWNFEETHGRSGPGDPGREFDGFNFTGADLHGISARNSFFTGCKFDGCALNFADLCFSYFHDCSFVDVEMRVTRIGSAEFNNCRFERSD